MAILGSHLSIAGGYYKAVEEAATLGCDCVQIFTKNNNQWRAKDLSHDDVAKFQEALAATNVSHPIAHDSYLINLATPVDELWKKSIDAYIVELQRAERLGLGYVVMHPGAHTTSSEEEGLARVITAFDEVHRQTRGLRVVTLIETTAGQGSCLGHKFEHIAAILAGVKQPERLAVCFDTCHVFAAGYPLSERKDYLATMRQFDKTIGLDLIRAFHLNDSKKGLGSRVDRHEHIGRGLLGLEAFRHLLNDPRFHETPMYLETAKEQEAGEEMDVVNLRVLRSLVEEGKSARRAKSAANRS
jgi:deoxyribonuclease IV